MNKRKRKRIPRKIRFKVYKKYNGHCAYCGREIDYKDMQVDHITPLYWHNGEDKMENYNPACRDCNFYKSTMTLEDFRESLKTIPARLEKKFIYRLAKKYGIVKEADIPIEFYFEKEETQPDSNKPDKHILSADSYKLTVKDTGYILFHCTNCGFEFVYQNGFDGHACTRCGGWPIIPRGFVEKKD